MKFAIISQQDITDKQRELAAEQNVEIIKIADIDVFSITPEFIVAIGSFDGVIVVHPAAAMRLASVYKIGVFENRLRIEQGHPIIFEEKSFHIYDLRRKSYGFSPGMI